ncbi:MAG: phage major capsid protein, partial [Alteraurantiacibacter sp.]
MDIQLETDVMNESFDIVARQDKADEAIKGLRSDVDEVKARVDKIGRAATRPVIGNANSTGTTAEPSAEVKGFVDGYLRRGRETEIKSISGATSVDGGYAVPREIDAMIASELKEISPIRQLAQVVQVGSAGYRKLVTTGGTASGWVGETTPRPETDTPDFAEISPPTGELYANPAASQSMLDDAAFDLEGWLASEVAMEFARAEGAAFVNGTGADQPLGFLSSPTSMAGDAVRPFGSVQYIGSGDADGFDASPEGRLIDLVHTMKAGHRQGASWVMNSATLSA